MKTTLRKSFTSENKIYFWTATINNWYNLLESNNRKEIIINSLRTLSEKQLITVYAFIIMPNHIHLIWQLKAKNGKETAKGSFMKFTAHEFKSMLKFTDEVEKYKVSAYNKAYEFWQRDSLAIEIWSREVAKQKLDYIHRNPVSTKWSLAKDDISYHYSSAKYYELGTDDFGFLNNLYAVFDGD